MKPSKLIVACAAVVVAASLGLANDVSGMMEEQKLTYEQVVENLKSADPEVRGNAIHELVILGECDPINAKKICYTILGSLVDEAAIVRETAATSLGFLCYQVPALATTELRSKILEYVKQMPEDDRMTGIKAFNQIADLMPEDDQ
ncbi:hypothetical protein FACS189472_05470 [Alphaproteobacteria bacterium]|nr:hypothetical protein FACS189472_05470 [Alphaproteobacteria bacterium]